MAIGRSVIFFTLFVSTVIGVSSCAKKQAPDTPYTRMIGTWKLAKSATDDNNNRQIESSEIHEAPSGQDYEITFNKDYTGVENDIYNGVVSPPLKFNWAITHQDSVWCAFAGHDTLTYYLVSASSGTLTLQTNTQFGLAWYSYNRK